MTNEFTVVGEHKENDLEFLVKGADGEYYDYSPVRETLLPVDPDGNWVITDEADPETTGGIPTADALDDA